jgi:hypothetical protein
MEFGKKKEDNDIAEHEPCGSMALLGQPHEENMCSNPFPPPPPQLPYWCKLYLKVSFNIIKIK